jgi:hypothetical protein
VKQEGLFSNDSSSDWEGDEIVSLSMAASKVAISYDEKSIRSLESYAKEVFSCSLAATG